MNRMINNFDVTFLCVIHENPGHGTDKARGHLGTELSNKASTVMQVGFEKDGNGRRTDLIKLNFLKCRSTKSHEPVFLEYSPVEKGLVLADESLIRASSDAKRQKARLIEVIEFLEQRIETSISATELVTELEDEFDCSKRVIERRLSQIISEEILIKNKLQSTGHLRRDGGPRNRCYVFVPKDKVA